MDPCMTSTEKNKEEEELISGEEESNGC